MKIIFRQINQFKKRDPPTTLKVGGFNVWDEDKMKKISCLLQVL